MSGQASVQAVHVGIEEISDGIVRLRGSRYCAVIQVTGVSIHLMSPGDREALLARYASFLNGLQHPVQILVRIVPADVSGYIEAFRRRASAGSDKRLRGLVEDHLAHVKVLTRDAGLLNRRFYVVVPAEDPSRRSGLIPRGPRLRRRAVDSKAILQQLEGRVETLLGQLEGCGLVARRLGTEELVDLYYACWCPVLSRSQPLPRSRDQGLVARAEAEDQGGLTDRRCRP